MLRRMRMNKKGEEMVEAAIVLPLVLLAILSMILLLVYFYTCLQTQIDLHHVLTDRQEHCRHVYQVSRASGSTQKSMRGLTKITMHKESQGRYYLMRPAEIILAGKEAAVYFKE
ncbi:MAG: hypothetical protein ACI4W2_05125 [Eubacterium sp.]